MQRILFYLLLVAVTLPGLAGAQVTIGMDNIVHQPTSSAILDLNPVNSGPKLGLLLPRIRIGNLFDRSIITNPANYLIVFSPYTEQTSQFGLNYWNVDRWYRVLNQSELFDSISTQRIAQIVLFAEQSSSETTSHNTDNINVPPSTPYTLPIDEVKFDSQNGYNKTTHEYVIPEDGFYEITCDVKIKLDNSGTTVQTFILVNGTIKVNDLVNAQATDVVGSVFYVVELDAGDKVKGAVGAGNWTNDKYKVMDSSLSIVKY
ncbi:MAG: hypothetical protein LBS05_02375 [Tannerellaceae bacterium]|jgi:hypothetical protein|nr:hypothetical protein [Tannerellaceae bacterium]